MGRQAKIHSEQEVAPVKALDYSETSSTLAYIGELSAELALMARQIRNPALADLLEQARFQAMRNLVKGMSDEGAV